MESPSLPPPPPPHGKFLLDKQQVSALALLVATGDHSHFRVDSRRSKGQKSVVELIRPFSPSPNQLQMLVNFDLRY